MAQTLEMDTTGHLKILERLLEKHKKSAAEEVKSTITESLKTIKALNQKAKKLTAEIKAGW
ncbi:MAG: hypothetical protein AAB019_09190 [Planctomycetota bacterium]